LSRRCSRTQSPRAKEEVGPDTGAGCLNFQTAAAPAFVNQGLNNFHLTTGSPMVDAGSIVASPPGTLDLDGELRELDGNCDGVARRDIGADELNRDCSPPAAVVTPVTPGPTPVPAAKKKCKKKKAKSAIAAKKKCKRKK
jgi:hypothetical protein